MEVKTALRYMKTTHIAETISGSGCDWRKITWTKSLRAPACITRPRAAGNECDICNIYQIFANHGTQDIKASGKQNWNRVPFPSKNELTDGRKFMNSLVELCSVNQVLQILMTKENHSEPRMQSGIQER